MSKYLTNKTNRLVIIRLNSGKSLFLEPGAVSGEIPAAEVNNNPMVKKLQDRGIITVEEGNTGPGVQTEEPAAAGKKKTKSTGGK